MCSAQFLYAYDFEKDGIYYSKTSDNTVSVTYGNSQSNSYSGEVTIPETVENEGVTYSVTSIGDMAFFGCSSLTKLTIGNSVTSIGDNAFYNCSSLPELTIPESVTSIGLYAFSYCTGLTKVTFSDGPDELKFYQGNGSAPAFAHCEALEYVYLGRNISGRGFMDNSNFTTLVISDQVTSIGKSAFYSCSSLTKLTIGNSVTSIGESAFYSCSSLTELTIGNSVTSIGEYAFQSCSSLTELTIPKSVTEIGSYAFYQCTALTDLTFSDGDGELTFQSSAPAFAYCESLEYVYLGRNISNGGFIGNPNFTTLEISNSVTSIGDWAFSNCDNLTTIVSLIEEPFDIGIYAFSSYSNATLYVPKNTKSLYMSKTGWQRFSKIIEDIKDEKAAAEEACQEWQKVYGEYLPGYAEGGDVTKLYQQAEAGQEANSSKAQELLSSIEALEKKISESAMSEEDKQSYLATLQEMKDKISALEKESSNDNLLSNPAHDEAMKSIGDYDAKFADYSKRIEEATTCKELTELAQEMASDAETFKTSCESDEKYLEDAIDRLSEILAELEKYVEQLKGYDTEVDNIIAEVFLEHQAEAGAAYKEAQSIYERYLYYYSGDGMESYKQSYKQIIDAQTENEGKASGILSEIDELIEKVKASAMTDEEKASYLKTLEELKTDVSALEVENKDILSDNTFYADVQGHYAEVAALLDYEQCIKEATTSAELLEIIEQMKAATEKVEKSCLAPVVIEYEKLAAIANRIAEIRKELETKTTELQACADDVDATIAEVFEKHQAEADVAYKEAQSIYEQYFYYYSGKGMESYEQIVDAQTENEGKASGILSEIDELIEKVKASAMTDEEKASYLKTLEELKASVSALEVENKDILSDNTFYADVQGHYAEVAAYYDGFASYEQRIKEATTSAELLEIIAEMEKATENVKTTCLAPVVSEYEKLAAIADELDKISEQLDAYATQLESVSGEVNDILTGIVNSVYGADDEIMVYTLSGMGQKMKKSDLRSLPKGIYIINGRKYVVK